MQKNWTHFMFDIGSKLMVEIMTEFKKKKKVK